MTAYEEPREADLREQLDLRPIHHAANESHPDTRPCPPWCYVAQQPEGDPYNLPHEVEYDRPYSAYHSMDPTPSIVATLYPASRRRGSDVTVMSTINIDVEQIGAGRAAISLRLDVDTLEGSTRKTIKLALEDARELIVALGYVCDQLEA